MHLIVIFALTLTALLPGFGQTAANAKPVPTKDPRELLASVAPFYDFSSPELKPWHMKATYQLYDLKGNPTEQGTWEYWWASPKVHRSTWTRAGAEYTSWSTSEGAPFHKESGNPLRYFERNISELLLSPLPARGVLDSGRMKLALKMLPPGKPELACVVTTLQWLVDGKLQAPSSGMDSYYCLDPATLALRMTYSHELTIQFSEIVKTQDRYLARQIVVTENKQKLFSASVQIIERVQPADAMFVPPADATLERLVPSPLGDSQGSVAMGSLVKATTPVYPSFSKTVHEQGVVVLVARIGTDGKIHDLEVLGSPSPLLAESAVDSVKKWEYKPSLMNGVPVEVDIIVKVTFNLDR